jgi:16S rRNA (guanine966-N2)-methyltransferase
MQVVGGKARGIKLKGAVTAGTRSTTGRVRAAIFNILQEELYQDGRALDLFAGSGSLGIEALSRGAAWADFVEWDRRQCRVIQTNLESTGFDSVARVHCTDVNRSLATLDGQYQVVLLDPPYALQDLDELLESIAGTPELVAAGGMVVAGHSRFLDLRSGYGSLRRVGFRRYGDNVVEFYQRESEEW